MRSSEAFAVLAATVRADRRHPDLLGVHRHRRREELVDLVRPDQPDGRDRGGTGGGSRSPAAAGRAARRGPGPRCRPGGPTCRARPRTRPPARSTGADGPRPPRRRRRPRPAVACTGMTLAPTQHSDSSRFRPPYPKTFASTRQDRPAGCTRSATWAAAIGSVSSTRSTAARSVSPSSRAGMVSMGLSLPWTGPAAAPAPRAPICATCRRQVLRYIVNTSTTLSPTSEGERS